MDYNRFHFTLWVARIAAAGLMAACLSAWTPSSLLAQSPALDDAETCVSCHQEESEAWEISPHGTVAPESAGETGGASCVDCHGEYVKGHPAEGPMSLSVDSSSCQDCHADSPMPRRAAVAFWLSFPCSSRSRAGSPANNLVTRGSLTTFFLVPLVRRFPSAEWSCFGVRRGLRAIRVPG